MNSSQLRSDFDVLVKKNIFFKKALAILQMQVYNHKQLHDC